MGIDVVIGQIANVEKRKGNKAISHETYRGV